MGEYRIRTINLDIIGGVEGDYGRFFDDVLKDEGVLVIRK